MRRARRLKFSANHPLNPELDHHIKHFDVNGITDDMDIVYTTVGNFFFGGGGSVQCHLLIFLLTFLVLTLVQQVLQSDHNILLGPI